MRMHKIYSLMQAWRAEEDKVNQLKQRDPVALGNGKILEAKDWEEAVSESQRIDNQIRIAGNAAEIYRTEKHKFELEIPARIKDMMENNGYKLIASWIAQGAQRQQFGPFVATYVNGHFQIDPYNNLNDLE